MKQELLEKLIEKSTQHMSGYDERRGNFTESYFDKEKFAELIIADMMLNLAAHTLSGSTAAQVFAQWQELYEGKVVERPVQTVTHDHDYDF